MRHERKRRTVPRSVVTVAITAMCCGGFCRTTGAQSHGISLAVQCEPVTAGEPAACQVVLTNHDDFGDTMEITDAYLVIDPLGEDLRDPPEGNLAIAELIGNAVALGPGGTLPVRIGAPGSTFSGLPGVAMRGEVRFGPGTIPLEFEPGILFLQGVAGWSDLCDHPDTVACSPFPHVSSFSAAIQLLPAPNPDVNDDGVVGALDLLEVIDAWGVCPPEPDPCPADVDGDGVVDVDDLVLVIVNWS